MSAAFIGEKKDRGKNPKESLVHSFLGNVFFLKHFFCIMGYFNK
jgi:hypothetical protein